MSIQKMGPHIAAIVIFLVVNVAYFYPQFQFQEKVVPQGDIVSFITRTKDIKDYEEETGRAPLWNNAPFSGKPVFPARKNLLKTVKSIFELGLDGPTGWFFCMMLVFYIALVLLGVNPWVSIVGALAFGFTSNHFILYEAGHNNKIRALVWLPFIASGFILAYRKKYLPGTALFTLGLGLNIMANHVQMTYYFGLCMIILGIMYAVDLAKAQKWVHLGKLIGLMGVGALLAIATNTTRLWTLYEYSRETMRGKPILEKQDQPAQAQGVQSSSETEGLSWSYAMQWSNGLIDVFTILVPGAAGGGSGELVGKGTKTYEAFKRNGMQPENSGKYRAPLYWGKLPFTSGPIYYGAGIFLLFVLSLFLIKGHLKWWALVAVLLTLLLSFGKNLEWFQRIFFDYFPIYNKFRAPNSILGITAFFFPFLAAVGLSQILTGKHDKATVMHALKWSGIITGGLCLFFALLGPSLFSFEGANDARYANSGFLDLIIEDRKRLMRLDAFRSLLFAGLTAAAIWAYMQGRLKALWVVAGLSLLTVVDLWGVGKRYLNADHFVPKSQYEQTYAQPRQVDQQILAQEEKRTDYRVYDLSINTFNSNSTSFFHNTIGGYHAAKLQRYQDLIDRHISKGNMSVLNMLNTKYIISQKGELRTNPGALGNAWLVDSIQLVNSPNEEINALGNLNTAETAVVLEKEFGDYVAGFDPGKNGRIELTNSELDILTYSFQSNSEQLAVFSEIWYGPDLGWQAYIDDEPVEHIRVNYALRALRVPAGEHTIRFEFRPSSYLQGERISLIASALVLFGIIGIIGWGFYTGRYALTTDHPLEEHKAAAGKGSRKGDKRAKGKRGKGRRKG